jgi:DNA polymerase-3 subunit gamma/tau
MISPQGFNALLKLVEEPPPHLRFIFATTDPDKVLSTIRSRTHNYAFRLVSTKVLQDHLASVCASEEIAAEPAALALVARAGAGSVRDSLSILGQVISGSGPEGVTYAEAIVQLGMTDSALLDATIDALIDRDGAALFTVIDQVIEAGHEPRRYVSDLLERLRNLIILKNVPGAVESGLVDETEEQVAIELAQSQRIGAAELSRAGDVVNSSLSEFRGATAPRLHLELMAARLLLPAIDDSELGLRSRIETLERGVGAHVGAGTVRATAPQAAAAHSEGVAASPPPPPPKLSEVAPSTAAPEPAQDAAPAAKKPAKAAAKATVPPVPPVAKVVAPVDVPVDAPAPTGTTADLTLSGIVTMWPAILDAVKAQSKVAWMLFNQSRPVSLEGGVLAVAVESAGKAANISSAGHEDKIAAAVSDVLHAKVKVDVVLAPDSAGAIVAGDPAAPSDVPSMDDADSTEESGVDLAMRALGATHIGKIEH